MRGFLLKCAILLGETGLYRFLKPGRLPIFLLHRIDESETHLSGKISVGTLRKYLDYLSANNFRVLGMEEFCSILERGAAFPSKSLVFTIDDGFYDHHDLAARVFEEYGFPLNFFVITGLLDQKLWPWDDQVSYAFNHSEVSKVRITLPSGSGYCANLESNDLKATIRQIRNSLKSEKQQAIYAWITSELYPKLEVPFPEKIPDAYRPMSWQDARSLRARGHGVFPHTYSHRILSALPRDEKRFEINESRKRIQQELGFDPKVFAYPTGRQSDYDSTDIEELKSAGFELAFNTIQEYAKHGNPPFEMPRFSLPQKYSEFLQIVNGLEELKRDWRVSGSFTPSLFSSR